MSRSLLEQLKHFLIAGDEQASDANAIANLVSDMTGDLSLIEADVDDIRIDVGLIEPDVQAIKVDIGLIDGDTSAMRSNVASISIDTNKLEDDMSRGVTNLGGKIRCVSATTVMGTLTFSKAGLGFTNNARLRMISLSCESAATDAIFNIALDALTCWEGYFNANGMGFLMLRFGEFWDEFTGTITVTRPVGSAVVEAKISIFFEDLADDSAMYATA